MSINDEVTPAYVKENLFEYIMSFLESYSLSDLMGILTDVIETIEWRKAQNE